MVVVATGTGIGGGVISDKGDVVRGSNFCGGELGHMVVAMMEEEELDEHHTKKSFSKAGVCSCGFRGCLEALASGSALTLQAERLIANGDLCSEENAGGGGGGAAAEDIPMARILIDAALGGNEEAKRVLDKG